MPPPPPPPATPPGLSVPSQDVPDSLVCTALLPGGPSSCVGRCRTVSLCPHPQPRRQGAARAPARLCRRRLSRVLRAESRSRGCRAELADGCVCPEPASPPQGPRLLSRWVVTKATPLRREGFVPKQTSGDAQKAAVRGVGRGGPAAPRKEPPGPWTSGPPLGLRRTPGPAAQPALEGPDSSARLRRKPSSGHAERRLGPPCSEPGSLRLFFSCDSAKLQNRRADSSRRRFALPGKGQSRPPGQRRAPGSGAKGPRA